MDPTEDDVIEQIQKIILELHHSIITFEIFKSQVFMFQCFFIIIILPKTSFDLIPRSLKDGV